MFLRAATALATAGSTALPELIRRTLAIPAASPTGTIMDVQHVVILMQENRSFDHYYGTVRGVRGFGDPRPMPVHGVGPQGRPGPVWRQPHAGHPDGYVLPYSLTGPLAAEPATCFAGLDHGWRTGQEALNGGRCDRWARAKSPQTMAHYREADLPFHCALAEAFTICDAYHCSAIGPTAPNRLFLWSGTNGQRDAAGPFVDGDDPFYAFSWTTYPERLQEAGITWRVYQQGLHANPRDPFGADNYSDNALQFFKAYGGKAAADSPLVARGNAVRTLDDLRADVRAGALPQVSWIVAPQGYSEHPQFAPAYGAAYIARVLAALTADPAVWSRTALFLMYDENDGFFDHMPPPMPPAPGGHAGRSTVDAGDEVFRDGRPYGLGPRVPMTVISPWTRGGWVCSQVFDHTSVIRFLEARFGVREPNISAWRRAVCGDLTAAFDFASPNAAAPRLPDASAFLAGHRGTGEVAPPSAPAVQAMPVQAPGTRPARALPYRLAATGRHDPAAGRFWIDFANPGSVGAVFHVFSAHRSDPPRIHTVGAGEALADAWSAAVDGGGRYDLTVYGANGFFRCFRGGLGTIGRADLAEPEVAASMDPVHGDLVLSLRNAGAAPCVLTVARCAYGAAEPRVHTVPAGGMVEDRWRLEESGGWYDLLVTAEAPAGFLRRLAGHVETGAPSISDPAMGALIAAAPFDG
jgi:phospholipase C